MNKRPHHSSKIGRALQSYVMPKSSSFDLEFNNQIRNKNPKWFRT
jgi:hypothetical protein